MTSLLNIAGNIPVVEAGGQSLRFEDGDSAYMTHTPTTAGNRKTWTFSTWIKRGNITLNQGIFGAESSGDRLVLGFGYSGSDQIRFYCQSPATEIYTTAVLRDPSAWYNIVWAVDTTQATATNRIKIYVNGEQITSFASASYPAQNSDYSVNNTVGHYIGRWAGYAGEYLDGYLANVAFIDGTALDPTSFGEYDDTLWKPKSDTDIQALTFGTNGFYLPFKQTTEAEGFSTVTYTGNGSSQAIKGVGFEPDLVWVKVRNTNSYGHKLYDSVRGFSQELTVDATDGEYTLPGRVSANSDGLDLGTYAGVNGSGNSYVAWCWDAGSGSAVSNTDGSVTSSVKANTTNGFSIVSYTGNGSNATIGHGLGVAPSMIIHKRRDSTADWNVYHASLGHNSNIILNTTAASYSSTTWNNTAPTSSVYSIVAGANTNTATYIAYCFHSVSGYSSIGSYSGTGASGNKITTGFKPAFVLLKDADSTDNWRMYDNTRSPSIEQGQASYPLYPNLSNAEDTSTGLIEFLSDGFEINSTSANNTSGNTQIYMAFADTRDATFFGDTSGNSNNWTPNALNNTDVVLDSPVTGGNFAVLNAVVASSGGLSEGNLKQTGSGAADEPKLGSIGMSSGKWYWEYAVTTASTSPANFSYAVGVATSNETDTNPTSTATSNRWAYRANFSAGDIISVAYDADAQKLWIALNNTWISSGDPAAGTNQYHDITVDTVLPYSWLRDDPVWVLNFGQDSSFAGNATPQGNTDDNGQGDFYYAPPSGFLCLKTSSLPTPAITAPDEHFNTVLYTGDGAASKSITGVGFQPDFVWVKNRSSAYDHALNDAVRGAGASYLSSNLTASESTYGDLYGDFSSFDSDGFTVAEGTDPTYSDVVFNNSGNAYVSWNWLAGGTAVSNTDGSITSTVSANQTAGFSIVSYVADGTNTSTVGHGLPTEPKMVIQKNRSAASDWLVYTDLVDGSDDYLLLNSTAAKGNAAGGATATVFNSWDRTSGNNMIAYCFAEVESYSKIGSYTGNGSTDGTFVHCGFRPAWVMVKRTDAANNWMMLDKDRSVFNVIDDYLLADSSQAEATSSSQSIDFLSNGIKVRNNANAMNASGGTYIFLAFAEAPFSKSNAR